MKKKDAIRKSESLARVVFQGFKGLERKLVEVYRGISGLISSNRTEVHERFDRIEKIILQDRNGKKTR